MTDLIDCTPKSRTSSNSTNEGFKTNGIGVVSPLLLVLLTMLLGVPVLGQETEPACPGDINLDGSRGPGDLALLSAHLAKKRVLGDQQLLNADVNLDRIVDVGDVTRLLKHTTGEFPLIPCGEFDPVEIACPGLSIGETSAQPLDEVSLGTLPEELEEPILALVTETEEEIGILAFVERLADDTATLTVPFYPGATLEGGPVDVQITDGFSACAPTSFSIESIPTAPGEFSRVVDALQEYVDDRAGDLGATSEELISGKTDLPTALIPLAIAQWLLDHPDNPDSLRAISAGTASLFEGDSDNTLLDAFSAQMNLVDLFSSRNRSGIMPAQTSVDPAGCGDSVENLDRCMETRALAADEDRPSPDLSTKKTALSILALKLYPVSQNGGVQDKADFLKKIVTANEFSAQVGLVADSAARALLPARFLYLRIQADPESLQEDDEQEGEWKAKLTAASLGSKYSFDRSVVRNWLKANLVAQEGQKAYDLVEKLFFKRGDVNRKIQDVILEGAKRMAPDAEQEPGKFEIPPEIFGPVSDGLAEEEWTNVEIRGNAVEQVEHKNYRAARASDLAQPTDIVVEVRTDEGRFGGVEPIKARARVEVLPIELTISPTEYVLEQGEQRATFTVEVENAKFPDRVDVDLPIRGSAEIDYQGDNTHRVIYTAPAFPPSDFSDSVIVRYVGETGARRPELVPLERTAEAQVTIREALEILVTGPGCVDPGSRDNQFSAEVVDLENQQVTWVSSSGQMQSDGTFLAPDSPEADVLITATSVDDPRAVGQTLVKVGGCGCWWTVEVADRIISGRPGVDFGTFFHVGEQVFVELDREPDDGNLTFRYDPADGGWWGGGRMPSGTPTFDNDEPLSGVFSENSQNAVEAVVSGTVEENIVNGNLVERRPVHLRVKFRIENDPDYWRNGCIVE